MDVEFKDINGNHVGLDLNDVVSSQVCDLGEINIDLKSGDLINSWIDYDGSTQAFNISVSYSNLKPKLPVLSINLDLYQFVNDFMFVGFSGSTQGSTEIHSIEWWSFSSSLEDSSVSSSASPPPPTASLMIPTANSVNPPPPSLPPSSSNSLTNVSKSSSSCHNKLCEQNPGAVAGVVTAGAFFLFIFAGVLIWVFSKKFKSLKKSDNVALDYIKAPKEFSYKELKLATKGFDSNRVIGHGAFGTVYKGIVAETEFNARLGDFGLARQIEHDKSPDATVAAGTMGYLAPEYLLTGRATEKTDVFSYGTVVLEVATGRRPIEKDNVGVGKVGVGSNLVEWVWSLHREGRLLVAADPRLGSEFDEGEMRRVLLVGLACSHPDPLARPIMRNVVQMLAGEAEVPIVPRARPSTSFSTSHLLLSLQDSVSDLNGLISLSTSSSDHSYNGVVELV
ncbi:Protein kinase domain [Dillenia turbinata]|uniref:Protein kinase domain n=1 Tax=Dillenia turbinata TaxID=194707 RepID=A0AAN8WBI7_9MAGN